MDGGRYRARADRLDRPLALRLRRFRTGSWAQVDPLRLSRAELRAHQHASDDTRTPVRAPLRFFSGGGAWVVLASLVASIGAFIALLTWPAMSGGALLPLRGTVAGLWSDAFYGLRPEGIDQVAPADPFSVIVAILGSAWPAAPSYALVLLWLLAAPLAVLGDGSPRRASPTARPPASRSPCSGERRRRCGPPSRRVAPPR